MSHKKIIHLFVSAFFLIMHSLTHAQKINQIDANGKRQGHWEKLYPNSEIKIYEGQFKDDKPIGKFKRYYPEGTPKAIMEFSSDGTSSDTKLYHQSGNLMGEGKHVDQKKDGIWKFYDEERFLTSQERYYQDLKVGESKTFYRDKTVAEIKNWDNDVEDGEWLQFYSGNIKMTVGSYKKGKLHGPLTKFYKDGTLMVKGTFDNGEKVGVWKYYEKDNEIQYTETYENGVKKSYQWMNGIEVQKYPSGKVKSEINYKNGKKDGKFVEYYDNGEWKTELRKGKKEVGEEDETIKYLDGQTIKIEGHYKNDKLHGKVTYFAQDGSIDKTEQFLDGDLVNSQ